MILHYQRKEAWDYVLAFQGLSMVFRPYLLLQLQDYPIAFVFQTALPVLSVLPLAANTEAIWRPSASPAAQSLRVQAPDAMVLSFAFAALASRHLFR